MTDKPTILVVDDEPLIRMAIASMLSDQYEVLTARSGGEGLVKLDERQDVCVIVSDQRMPEMDGSAFFARALTVSSARRVMISGYTDFGALVRAVNEGHIYAFLEKPFAPEALRQIVEEAAAAA